MSLREKLKNIRREEYRGMNESRAERQKRNKKIMSKANIAFPNFIADFQQL